MSVEISTKTILDKRGLEEGDQVSLTLEGGQRLLLTAELFRHEQLGVAEVFLCFDPADPTLPEDFVRSLPPHRHRWGDGPLEWGRLALWSPVETGAGVVFKRLETVAFMTVTADSLISRCTLPVTAIEVP